MRARVRALPHVKVSDDHDARGLVTTPDRSRVTGVRVRLRDSDRETPILGDLVVDATGRGARSPHWLAELGYDAPDEERFKVGVHYTTRLFRREPTDLDGCRHVVATIPPHGRRGGFALAIEDDRWLVTLVGRRPNACCTPASRGARGDVPDATGGRLSCRSADGPRTTTTTRT